jgi:hypothetical protein
MARPIWPGEIVFGLVTLPVSVCGAERRGDRPVRLLETHRPARACYHTPPAALRLAPRKGCLQPRQSITQAPHVVGPR